MPKSEHPFPPSRCMPRVRPVVGVVAGRQAEVKMGVTPSAKRRGFSPGHRERRSIVFNSAACELPDADPTPRTSAAGYVPHGYARCGHVATWEPGKSECVSIGSAILQTPLNGMTCPLMIATDRGPLRCDVLPHGSTKSVSSTRSGSAVEPEAYAASHRLGWAFLRSAVGAPL